MANDEKTVEHTERDGGDGEQVHRSDNFPVVTDECEPTFGSLRISWRAAHPTGDSSPGDLKTQHQQLAVDTRCAPGCVLGHHPKDEIAKFLRNPSSTGD